ncbi:P-loop containing nucleoside triphosphate hydrolase protein [Russula earlei]|uniref:P-loop containing nucleoside triphosphate hydrolase protein n=1 Tax=Russula earlei TaxID=71964 RepID=A0ACC0TYW6_9AGAM|nr:P-loop containing nucleoside triphosphate hydrolase protein [Russula earlei]
MGHVIRPTRSAKPRKEVRKTKSLPATGETGKSDTQWPDYFKEALNTVLAFCTSRQQFATSFNSLRASIEGLLKRLVPFLVRLMHRSHSAPISSPLELEKVAEIKALLPELLTFAYTPANHLKFNGSSQQAGSQEDIFSDFAGDTRPNESDESEHVLVLEMDDSMVRKKRLPSNSQVYLGIGSVFYVPLVPEPLNPASVKHLIEKRNAIFSIAVNELIAAFSDPEDPVALLLASAREHIPLKTGCPAESSHIPEPENRQPIDRIVEEIYEQKWYLGQIKYRKNFDAKAGSLGSLDPPLSDSIATALRDARRITTLYAHQTKAITALSQGKDVIVSTSTASGKSVPLLQILEQEKAAKALFIYPTKATLEQLLACCPGLESITVSTYDGDTPQDERPTIRDTASVLFTNIDTIHAAILPHEEQWRRFLKCLKLVVIDELHYYHDMFGSHVALVMRRLRRICAAVGNRHIRFVSCSATISRPKEHMKTVFRLEDVQEIIQDGAPSGRKEFLLWSCPNSTKASPIGEATRVMAYLMKRGVRVILFCKTRKSCELAMKTLRTALSMEQRYDVLNRVMAYRGGYRPSERRKIEQDAFSGKLLGLVATNALELGVDIGVLDAVIVCGFPTRQQIGRAGRRARDSLAIYVTEQTGIDCHYFAYPDDLFDKPTSDLIVDVENPLIIEAHLQCAAFEMPLSGDDTYWFGPSTIALCETKLVRDKEGWFHTHPKHLPYPAAALSIRGADEERYTVIDVSNTESGVKGRILEETEISRALFELYEGAIFLHQGRTFIVKEINHDSKQAKLVRTDVGWITTPRDIDPIQTRRIREIKGSLRRALYGKPPNDPRSVSDVVKKRRSSDQRIIESVEVDMPPYENTTTGMWIDVSKDALNFLDIEGASRAGAIHSASHAFLNRFPMAADLRTECKPIEKEMKVSTRKRPARLIFHDPVGRSIGGVAAKAFDHTSCDCVEGCENCIASSFCKEGNDVRSKRGALVVLRDILGIPLGEPERREEMDPLPLTVVEAPGVGVAEGVVVEREV